MLTNHLIKNIPTGIRTISLATAIRFIGWGIFEAALPIFVFSLVQNYTESALVSSVYNIVYIISLPIAGLLADKKSSKVIILFGLWLYPIIGISYFIAGAYSIILFVIIGKFINGISYAFDNVGRQTYFRRHSNNKNASTVFGYYETVSTGWWILALIGSIWILPIIDIHYLFLAIIPTVLVAIAMVHKVEDDRGRGKLKFSKRTIDHGKKQLKTIRGWIRESASLLIIIFSISFVYSFVDFILPINVFSTGGSLQAAVMIAILAASPTIFAFHLSHFAEKRRVSFLGYGIILALVGFLILFFFSSLLPQLIVAFIIGLAFQFVILASDGLITMRTPANLFGKSSAMMLVAITLGGTFGMIILGLVVDKFGVVSAIRINLILCLVLFIIFLFKRKKLAISINEKHVNG